MLDIYKYLGKHLYTRIGRKFNITKYLCYIDKMGEKTTLTKASSKSESLRTTVPSGIVKQFYLNEKDQLEWEIKIINGELALVVKPIKK